MNGTYNPKLARQALVKRPAPPQPGTPEANPSATLIEPKARVGGRRGIGRLRRRSAAEIADDPSRWVALPVASNGDGRRSPGPRVVVPIPLRSRVVRRTVGTADRYAGGTVRDSEWNAGWRWYLQLACAGFLIMLGWTMLVMGAGLIGLLS